METFTRLAGMTETSELSEAPSHPVAEPKNNQNGSDADLQSDNQQPSQREPRASLPLNRQPSRKSFRSSNHPSRSASEHRDSPIAAPEDYPPLPTAPHQAQQGRPSHDSARSSAGTETEFVWGPNHPCFPHPNPHCAQDSEEARSTRVIRVKRDWLQAGDLYPQYANLYPEILDPLVTDDDFRFLISNINARLKSTFDPYTTRAWVDALLGAATGFIWDDLGLTGAKRGIKELEGFIDKWNEDKQREGKEVRLVQLRRTGFMAMDFVVPDPGIELATHEDGSFEGGIGPAE